jgi:hypothetical protein
MPSLVSVTNFKRILERKSENIVLDAISYFKTHSLTKKSITMIDDQMFKIGSVLRF